MWPRLGVTFDKQQPVFAPLQDWWPPLSLTFTELGLSGPRATEGEPDQKRKKSLKVFKCILCSEPALTLMYCLFWKCVGDARYYNCIDLMLQYTARKAGVFCCFNIVYYICPGYIKVHLSPWCLAALSNTTINEQKHSRLIRVACLSQVCFRRRVHCFNHFPLRQ